MLPGTRNLQVKLDVFFSLWNIIPEILIFNCPKDKTVSNFHRAIFIQHFVGSRIDHLDISDLIPVALEYLKYLIVNRNFSKVKKFNLFQLRNWSGIDISSIKILLFHILLTFFVEVHIIVIRLEIETYGTVFVVEIFLILKPIVDWLKRSESYTY